MPNKRRKRLMISPWKMETGIRVLPTKALLPRETYLVQTEHPLERVGPTGAPRTVDANPHVRTQQEIGSLGIFSTWGGGGVRLCRSREVQGPGSASYAADSDGFSGRGRCSSAGCDQRAEPAEGCWRGGSDFRAMAVPIDGTTRSVSLSLGGQWRAEGALRSDCCHAISRPGRWFMPTARKRSHAARAGT